MKVFNDYFQESYTHITIDGKQQKLSIKGQVAISLLVDMYRSGLPVNKWLSSYSILEKEYGFKFSDQTKEIYIQYLTHAGAPKLCNSNVGPVFLTSLLTLLHTWGLVQYNTRLQLFLLPHLDDILPEIRSKIIGSVF